MESNSLVYKSVKVQLPYCEEPAEIISCSL